MKSCFCGKMSHSQWRSFGSRFFFYKKRVWLSKDICLLIWWFTNVGISDWLKKPYPWLFPWSSLIMVGPLFFCTNDQNIRQERSLWQQTGNSCRFNGQGMEGWWIDIDFGENNWPILVGVATIMVNQWSIDSWNRLHAFGFEKKKRWEREKKWLGFNKSLNF